LGINQRYFFSKEDLVEMFGAYMQEVNLKKRSHKVRLCFGYRIKTERNIAITILQQ